MNRNELIEELLFKKYNICIDGAEVWSFIIQNISIEKSRLNLQDIFYKMDLLEKVVNFTVEVLQLDRGIEVRLYSIDGSPIKDIF